MQFLYHAKSGENILNLEAESFLHLKVRRVKEGTQIILRNLNDNVLYYYEITKLSKNSCILSLVQQSQSKENQNIFSIALAMIDPKILEKTLPFLNELGVGKLILVYTDFSQKNFKLDLQRINRILINSCEQCGRGSLMQIESYESVEKFLQIYPKVVLVDFEGKKSEFSKDKLYFIGPEGGFSERERELFKEKISLQSPYILRSQSAIIGLVGKILL